MCGRFTLRTPAQAIAKAFNLPAVPELFPHYNIAPTQALAAVRRDPDEGSRQLVFLHWGLIPSWADNRRIGNRMINARAETVASKPAFRQAFLSRRCLVVADGFYEWQKSGRQKQPFYIRMKDEGPFAFAGLWEHWHRGKETIDSCTIITTEANEVVRPIHDRMPVIVAPADYDLWLDPAVAEPERLAPILRSFASESMTASTVDLLVNNPKNDIAECIEPVERPGEPDR